MAQGRDIIVVGASAGGIQALSTLVLGLPAGFNASVFVATHLLPSRSSLLPDILDRATTLPVSEAWEMAPIERSHIYVAPPGRQLLLQPGYMRLLERPPDARYLRCIDGLFRSAARAYRRRVIGVVLTGMLDDGASGLVMVKDHGGLAVIQSPVNALYPEMPCNALKCVAPDACLPVHRIPAMLERLSSGTGSRAGSRRVPATHAPRR